MTSFSGPKQKHLNLAVWINHRSNKETLLLSVEDKCIFISVLLTGDLSDILFSQHVLPVVVSGFKRHIRLMGNSARPSAVSVLGVFLLLPPPDFI